jgi:methanogenic corrinoid protein MtbC1
MNSLSNQAKLIPLSDEGRRILERESEDIGKQVTDGYFASHPQCYQGDSDRIRQMCKADFQHHLKFLLGAMVTATPEIFIEYTLWLKDVLNRRNLSIQHPIESFSRMRSAINLRLNAEDQVIACIIIDGGIDALQGDGSFQGLYQPDPGKTLALAKGYTESLVDGNRSGAERIIRQSQENGISLVDIGVGIIQPAMVEIGRLWQENRVTVAKEHLATAISQNVLARAFANAEFADPVDKTVVAACIEGNHHSLGLRIVTDAYETAGWNVVFLGADTPVSSILSQVDADKPDVLALSICLPHQVLALQQLITQLRSEMAGSMPAVVVGGLAINTHQVLASRLKIDNWYIDAKSLQDDLH